MRDLMSSKLPITQFLKISLGFVLIFLFFQMIYLDFGNDLFSLLIGSLVLLAGYFFIYFLFYKFSLKFHFLIEILIVFIPGMFVSEFLSLGFESLVLFIILSLFVSALKNDRGCEVFSIPNLFFKKNVSIACPVFSPIESFEEKVNKNKYINKS